jgi:hypothetical protein
VIVARATIVLVARAGHFVRVATGTGDTDAEVPVCPEAALFIEAPSVAIRRHDTSTGADGQFVTRGEPLSRQRNARSWCPALARRAAT